MEKILLVGFGGHAHSVIDTIIQKNEYEIAGYVGNEEHDNYLDIKYLGTDDNLKRIFDNGISNAFVCIGFMGSNNKRDLIYNNLKSIGFKLPSVIDRTAIIANNVDIGEGSFVAKGTVINANTKIGKMCIINSKSLIEHDCEIGDFTHVAVSACLCGGVKVGNSSFIGANSTVIQCLKLGNNVFVGAGQLVTNDINDKSRITIGKSLYE